MAKYRKMPIVVDAEQFASIDNPPRGVFLDWDNAAYVDTINKHSVPVNLGDWVIMEPDGVHFYPCDPDVFASTYEPA